MVTYLRVMVRLDLNMRIAVVNLKGGVGKTTTAVCLALELAKRGRTLLVDADPQQSAISWSEQAGWTSPVTMARATKDLNRWVPSAAVGAEHVVIDTPPGHPEIVTSAALAADMALIPVPPSLMDFDRLRPTVDLLANVEPLNPGLDVRVLLTRLRSGTTTSREARGVLAELGIPVLETEIPLRESYAVAFGTVPSAAREYADLLGELLGEEVPA
jgi:chromosome partitioning protein